MRGPVRLLVLCAGLALCSSARASENIRLAATRGNGQGILFSCNPAPCQPDNQAFRSLMTELGYVAASRTIGSASSLGHAGFELGVSWAGHVVSGDQAWRTTEQSAESGTATGFLNGVKLDVRKGLPLSLEVGAQLQWILDSQMVVPGLDLQWSFLEGDPTLPELAVRAAVTTMVGARDFDLTTLSFELRASKSFPVGGVAELSPYMAWTSLFIAASSGVIDPTPGEFVETGAGNRPDTENDIVFDSVDLFDDYNGRLTLGLQSLFSVVAVAVQGDLQMFSDGQTVGPVGTVSTQVSLQF